MQKRACPRSPAVLLCGCQATSGLTPYHTTMISAHTRIRLTVLSAIARSLIARTRILDFNLSNLADGSFLRYVEHTGREWVADACVNLLICAMRGELRRTNIGGYRSL
jgi:hypothetical protein